MIKSLFNTSRKMIAVGVTAGAITLSLSAFAPNQAFATTACDKVNIVYCGLSGNSASSYLASFKDVYAKNTSGHSASPTVKKNYTDIQAIYAWAGVSAAHVSNMNNTNTKLGTLYKDGRIVVDGKTVATDSWVSARFTEGQGFVHITGNAYARKTTTSFANPTAKVLVYMPEGQMKFAVMIECGNAVKATPVKEKPVETPKTPETPVTETPVEETPQVTTASIEKPAELPQTGVGNLIGLFSGASITGIAAHRLINRRK